MILFIISIVLLLMSYCAYGYLVNGVFGIIAGVKNIVVKLDREVDSIPFHLKVLAFPLLFVLFSCAQEDVFDEKQEIKNAGVEVIDIQEAIIDCINAYRGENNLSYLEHMNIIKEVAATHTSYMIEKGVVSHDNFYTRQQKLKESANAIKVAENVAYGYTKAESVVNAWINSDKHREIIEGDYTHIGISARKNDEGRIYYTLMFIKK